MSLTFLAVNRVKYFSLITITGPDPQAPIHDVVSKLNWLSFVFSPLLIPNNFSTSLMIILLLEAIKLLFNQLERIHLKKYVRL